MLTMVRRTTATWWALLPILLTLLLIGWMGYHLSIVLAERVMSLSSWLALAMLALGVLLQLTCTIVALRTIGHRLGIRQVADAEDLEEETGESLVDVLGHTLLPFLAIYAAFGYLQQAAQDLSALSILTGGLFSNLLTDTGIRHNPERGLWAVSILITTYLLRRGLDLWRDRGGSRLAGALSAVTEAFFLIVAIFYGAQLAHDVAQWWDERMVNAWIDAGIASVAAVLAQFNINLPAILTSLWQGWTEVVWPAIWQVLVQPLAWLAMAALAFGMRTLTVATLWGTDGNLARLLPVTQRLQPHRARLLEDMREHKRELRGSRTQWVVLQVQEAFLSDLDDKVLPTLQSWRMVLRAGLPFLAAFIPLYTLIGVVTDLVHRGAVALIGGHPFEFWNGVNPTLGLINRVGMESVRLVLLAVAFQLALQIHRHHATEAATGPTSAAAPVATTGTAPDAAPAPDAGEGAGRPVVRKVPAVLLFLTAWVVSAIPAMATESLKDTHQYVQGTSQEPVEVNDMHIAAEYADIGQRYTDPITGEEHETQGRFVVVILIERAPGRATAYDFPVLVSGSDPLADMGPGADRRTYRPLNSATSALPDGFAQGRELLYEVHPDDLSHLSVQLQPREHVFQHQKRVRIDLDIPADAAETSRGVLVEYADDSLVQAIDE